MQRTLTRWLLPRFLAAVALCALLAAPVLASAEPSEEEASRAVLVTGASSGIGRKITERLAGDGYFVYATARKKQDLEALGAIKNVQPLHLDVTQPADIATNSPTRMSAANFMTNLLHHAPAKRGNCLPTGLDPRLLPRPRVFRNTGSRRNHG